MPSKSEPSLGGDEWLGMSQRLGPLWLQLACHGRRKRAILADETGTELSTGEEGRLGEPSKFVSCSEASSYVRFMDDLGRRPCENGWLSRYDKRV